MQVILKKKPRKTNVNFHILPLANFQNSADLKSRKRYEDGTAAVPTHFYFSATCPCDSRVFSICARSHEFSFYPYNPEVVWMVFM